MLATGAVSNDKAT